MTLAPPATSTPDPGIPEPGWINWKRTELHNEPSRIIASITAAITATVGVLVVVGVLSNEVGGALTVAAGAWVLTAGELVRARVTPNDRVKSVFPPPPPGGE